MLNPKKIEIPSRDTYKLDGMRSVADRLSHPELGRKTILVAGTNGKGSTCAYLTELFVSAGLKVGTYSSPHVVERTERIRINSKPISERLLKKYEKNYSKSLASLTYFERMTVLAFLIFRDLNVDLQILEVGIGGRLDATNIAEPDFSAITRIDFDHCEVLGPTLRDIAFEKSGIMRMDRPCFVAAQLIEAKRSIQDQARATRAQLKFVQRNSFSSSELSILKGLEKSQGLHQFQNAALALSVFRAAEAKWTGLKQLSRARLKDCFSRNVLWPARLQVISKSPVLLIDGAHNENSIEAFVKHFKAHYSNLRDVQCVFGVMKDKNLKMILKMLGPLVSHFHLPGFYKERELPAKDLMLAIQSQMKAKAVTTYATLPQCLRSIQKVQKTKRLPVIVVGSLYLAGAVLLRLKRGRR